MRTFLKPLAASLLFAACAAANAGTATVLFSNVDKYTDFPSWEKDRDDLLNQIGNHIVKRAGDGLPANEQLKVELLQFDMAGRMVTRNAIETRVIGSNDWPSFRLRYVLLRDGAIVGSGEESVQGMEAASGRIRYVSDDPLRLEKTMIDHWFKTKFAKAGS